MTTNNNTMQLTNNQASKKATIENNNDKCNIIPEIFTILQPKEPSNDGIFK